MLYEFEVCHNATEATKNICGAKGKSANDYSVTYWPSAKLSNKRYTCVNNRCIRSKISGYNLDCGRVELGTDVTPTRGRENQLTAEGWALRTPGCAAQQNEKEVLLKTEELGVNMLQSAQSPTHFSHITLLQPFCNHFEYSVRGIFF